MASLFQFSIRSLLAAVTIAAVGVVALLNANVWWEGGTWLVALTLVGAGILLAIYRRGEQRAYWLGFVIFGGLYVGLIVVGAITGTYHNLLPSQLAGAAHQWMIPAEGQNEYVPPAGLPGPPMPIVTYTSPVILSSPYAQPVYSSVPPPATTATPMSAVGWIANPNYVSLEKFISIGHSLWLLLAAAIGGKLCQWICRTQPKRSCSPPTES